MNEPRIVFEDKEVMVIVKPALMTTTNEGREGGVTLENWLRVNVEGQKSVPRAGIVHRLDKGTSGLVAVARDRDSLEALRKQFKERTVTKVYLAVAGGDLPFEGEIKAPIRRSAFFGKWQVGIDGKEADTLFKVKKKIVREGKVFSLIEVTLKSGRTHQIRVHFKYLGWPLLGDKVYGGMTETGLVRPFLHAYRLEFDHPKSGRRLQFREELPEDLTSVLKNYVEKKPI